MKNILLSSRCAELEPIYRWKQQTSDTRRLLYTGPQPSSMVNMQTLPTSLSLLVCSLLATSSSALHVRPRLDTYPTPAANLPNAAAPAAITAAPSLKLGDLKFARALPTFPSCATSCVASAITKSTDCKLGDYQCECNFATVINQGAATCVQSACGFEGALRKWIWKAFEGWS